MNSKKQILKELNELIAKGQPIADSYTSNQFNNSYHTDIPEDQLREFVIGASAAIDRIAGRESQFYRQTVIDSTKQYSESNITVMSIQASLKALKIAVKKDHLLNLKQLAQAEVFDDFLEQSKTLIKANYHIAAMVLIGGVLEEYLRKLCISKGLKDNVQYFSHILRKR